jgi:hypothetical protein
MVSRKLLAVALVMAVLCAAGFGAATVRAGDLSDLGFEDGTMGGWQVVSNVDQVTVIGTDAFASAYWGDYMVLLGKPYTGLGDTQPIGPNAIAKDFTVFTPCIAFAYNFFTVDWIGYDRFAYLVTLSQNGTVIASFSMTAMGEPPTAGTVKSTGWSTVNLDLSLYRGQELTIDIRAGGTADIAWPTWVYFDMSPVLPSMGDTIGPVITLPRLDVAGTAVTADSATDRRYVLVTDITDDSGWVNVGILQNGSTVAGGSSAGWRAYNLALSEGSNDVVITAADASGNTASRKLTVFVDSRPPEVTLEAVPRSTANASLVISGTVLDTRSGVASLTIDGAEVAVGADGTFASSVPLAVGSNTNTVTARDSRGNAVSWDVVTTRIRAGSTGYIAMNGTLTVGSTLGMLDGVSFPMDAAPVIKDGRTLLPIRALIETLGGRVSWNKMAHAATVTLGGRSVVLEVGKNTALVNGKAVPIDPTNAKVAPVIIGSRTFLPLRFVAENLGLELAWEPVSQTISFTYWP